MAEYSSNPFSHLGLHRQFSKSKEKNMQEQNTPETNLELKAEEILGEIARASSALLYSPRNAEILARQGLNYTGLSELIKETGQKVDLLMEASQFLDAAIEISPEDPYVLTAMASYIFKYSNPALGYKHFIKSREIKKEDQDYEFRVKAYERAVENAVALLLIALQKDEIYYLARGLLFDIRDELEYNETGKLDFPILCLVDSILKRRADIEIKN